MTEPKTPQELNAAVAKALGLMLCKFDHLGFGCLDEYKQRTVIFNSADDPATAVWAIDKFCDDRTAVNAYDRHTWDVSTDIYPKNSEKGKYVCSISSPEDTFTAFGATFCEAICRAIVGAAG